MNEKYSSYEQFLAINLTFGKENKTAAFCVYYRNVILLNLSCIMAVHDFRCSILYKRLMWFIKILIEINRKESEQFTVLGGGMEDMKSDRSYNSKYSIWQAQTHLVI